MPLFDSLLNPAADTMTALITHLSMHTALPDVTGSNESTAPREPVTWDPAASGDADMAAPVVFSGGAPSGPAPYIGFWEGPGPGGIFHGWTEGIGDQTFNAAGELTVETLTLPGTAV